ncbi:MAG: hypothetical protein JO090_10170 [Rhizobacter sp.]|nr:hypothetical protein [Rhizobacter sp.]
MSRLPETRYPSRRSYVLKLRADATPEALAGRLENLVTGQRIEFACGPALVQALGAELEADSAEARGE